MEESIMTAKRFKVCDYPTGRVLEDIVNHKELDDIDYVCELLNELHEENQTLKKQLESEHTMLDNAILLERTRMGQNSLKQYKEAIQ